MGTSKERALNDVSSQSSPLRQDHADTRVNDFDAVREVSQLSAMAEQVEKTGNAENKVPPPPLDQKGSSPSTACDEVAADGGQRIIGDGVRPLDSDLHKASIALEEVKKEKEIHNPESCGGHSSDSDSHNASIALKDVNKEKEIQNSESYGFQSLDSDGQKASIALEDEKKEKEIPNPVGFSDQSQFTYIPDYVPTNIDDTLEDKPRSPVSITHASDVSHQTLSPDTKTPTVESCNRGNIVAAKPETRSDSLPQILSPDAASLSSQSNQLMLTSSVGSEKYLDKLQPRRNPDTAVQLSPSSQGIINSVIPEKPSEDGYNWRKYGQKLVKGNEFVRSYYKCTYPNCLAKKQVERSNAGHITDINYLGKHEHPKPQPVPQIGSVVVQPLHVGKPETPAMNLSEADKPSTGPIEMSQPESAEVNLPIVMVSSESVGGGDDVGSSTGRESKRQKKDISTAEDPALSKPCSEARHVVQTRSEVDLVNDGYRWRKYGQKLVKGNPNPRSYYRCSNAGCPVKKHVERASHDPKLVITTYEGQHDHDMPGSRSVTQNASSGDAKVAARTGDRSEPGESKPNGIDMVIHIGAN